MTSFDASQLRVLRLDPRRHARVLGAPGTGKTELLIESCVRLLREPGWGEGSVLVLGVDRLSATRLRRGIEERAGAPLSGAVARTAVSFAFRMLRQAAAERGRAAPRLLTGTAHDEVVAEVLTAGPVAGEGSPFTPEMRATAAFRAELRELARVLDDHDLDADDLRARLRSAGSAREAGPQTLAPDDELLLRWAAALDVLDAVDARLAADRPDERSASGLLRECRRLLRSDAALEVPRLVLVDDAHDIGAGQLALLGALAARGATIWAFGDPDIATGAFHGERARLLAGIVPELSRVSAFAPGAASAFSAPSAFSSPASSAFSSPASMRAEEQLVVLEAVHRHGLEIRGLVAQLTSRIGAAGVGAQRRAVSARPDAAAPVATVHYSTVSSSAEQWGAIAHRLRRRRLGLDRDTGVPWSEMAVICRSRDEVVRAARTLAAHQVPTSVAAGGVVLREHQIVRELIRLLQDALGIDPLRPEEIAPLLGGVLGGLDPVALRRLRGAVRAQELRAAREEERSPDGTDARLWEAWRYPGQRPILDSRGGRRLRRLGLLSAAAVTVRERGGTPRETLWALWEGAGIAAQLQETALAGRGARADEANRALDAVTGLFFALQRHEEQGSERPIDELLDDLLASTVPEDSLAGRSERDVVTVTTPQGVVGREFAVVCLAGLQDGAWPNLRSRGMLLGVSALERWLGGGTAEAPARKDTLHDELRLYAQACSRARDELLVVAIANDEQHPSAFYGLGRQYERAEALPSTRLTLRGAVAEMRRRLTRDPDDRVAADSLAALARAGAPGADPDEWYGILPPTTTAPLVDLDDPEAVVRVSPSRIEAAERCPLDWVVSSLAGSAPTVSASIGTLLHHAFERAARSGAPTSAEDLMRLVDAEWDALVFEAAWDEERQHDTARAMADHLAGYLRAFVAAGGELRGVEERFSLRIGAAELSGVADRLESRIDPESGRELVTVVDLKTGTRPPTESERAAHAQLLAYQMGLRNGAFGGGETAAEPRDATEQSVENGGAKLLYVHPKALPKRGERWVEAQQAPVDDAGAEEFAARVERIAAVMAAGSFVANVEHHCENEHAPGTACRLHVIPAVSHS